MVLLSVTVPLVRVAVRRWPFFARGRGERGQKTNWVVEPHSLSKRKKPNGEGGASLRRTATHTHTHTHNLPHTMTPADVAKLKVADLRAELSVRGLDTKGLKAELVARLTAALEAREVRGVWEEGGRGEGGASFRHAFQSTPLPAGAAKTKPPSNHTLAQQQPAAAPPPVPAAAPSPPRPKRGRGAAAAPDPAPEPAPEPKRGRSRRQTPEEEAVEAEGGDEEPVVAAVAPPPPPPPAEAASPPPPPPPQISHPADDCNVEAAPLPSPPPVAAPVAPAPPLAPAPPPPPPADVHIADASPDDDDDDDDDAPAAPAPRPTTVVSGRDCPHLATINRAALDFDFEPACSVTLSPVNVYACLVCGKYFAGRGPRTPASAHALGTGHAVFLRLSDGAAFVLPDGARVEDPALDSVRAVLDPRYTQAEVAALDAPPPRWARALDGTPFAPGLVGINNLKASDYMAVAVQALARVPPLRDFFLVPSNYREAASRSPLVYRFGALLRKLWNPAAFKGHVSPHEFAQAVLAASGGRFTPDARADAASFLVWLVNALHTDLAIPPVPGGPAGPAAARLASTKTTIISDCFRGELEVVAQPGAGGVRVDAAPRTTRAPFHVLALDLPPAPLYQDALEKNIIPQVPIFELLRRYDGVRVDDGDARAGRRTLRVTRWPRYLTTHVKRFTKNAFFGEKNPTIVTFPVKGLDVGRVLGSGSSSASAAPSPPPPRYDIIANIVHDGPAGGGHYKCHILRANEGTWYDVDDLSVAETLAQVVALSEAYIQVYQRVDGAPPGAGGGDAMQVG